VNQNSDRRLINQSWRSANCHWHWQFTPPRGLSEQRTEFVSHDFGSVNLLRIAHHTVPRFF